MQTPADHDFQPRRLELDWNDELPRYWYGGDVFATHYMNALSLLFPHGEKFFIDAVRAYRDRCDDPRLEREIRAFIGQEGWHRSVHADYNDWLGRLGLPAGALDARAGRKTERVRRMLPRRAWLAATVCLEHFTAILAKDLLANPQRSAGMHPHFRRLWTWHAMEELEHKSVAFDLYQATGGRYWVRVRAMLVVSVDFGLDVARNLVALIRADGQAWRPRVWLRGLDFLFGRNPGLVWKVLPAWFAFFRRDFHPWQQDDRPLIAQALGDAGLRASLRPAAAPSGG
jgi:predicted metal-dependent hydrolase